MTDVDPGQPARPVARRRQVGRLLGIALIVLVLALAAVKIYQQRHQFATSLHRVGVATMLASFVCGALGIAVTFGEWREVLVGLGVRVRAEVGLRVFFASQLGKYLPGSIWPVVLQVEAGRRWGASRRTMLAANLLTLVLGCTTGLILACALLPFSSTGAAEHYWWILLALPVLLALLHPRAVPLILNRMFQLLRREPVEQALPLSRSLRASGWAVVSFVLLGLHIALLVGALSGWHGATLPLSVGAISLAVCLGVLAIPVPAGAGVRDAVLAVALAVAVTHSQGLVIAVTSRVMLIAADLLLAGLAGGLRTRGHGEQPPNPATAGG